MKVTRCGLYDHAPNFRCIYNIFVINLSFTKTFFTKIIMGVAFFACMRSYQSRKLTNIHAIFRISHIIYIYIYINTYTYSSEVYRVACTLRNFREHFSFHAK